MIRPTMSHAVNKDELHRLMSDYAAHLEQQLAKANERVAEKQKAIFDRDNYIQESRQENGEYAILIAYLVRRADVKTDLLQNPTFEKASEQLNKFAIEKKIEGYVKGFIRGYEQCKDDTESGNWTDDEESLFDYARDFSEQLRKEQE